MSHWNGVSDSGILRKTMPVENHDELLVFGYGCKLFRDDEKAISIDQGKHLIPWMGDQKLKIDRYDCRGALSDLSKYEASREGYDATRWLGLSEKERQLEELCDNERYYSLKINEEEEEMYKEEELKRTKTNAIQYSYDVPQNPELKTEGIPTVPEADEIDEEYSPPPILDVPVDIEIPRTVKENARIEKTALFVSRQGLQMEILIKAKQADNPQFSFLNQGDPLYKFYRHVLAAFKNGRYQGYVSSTKRNTDELNNSADQDSGGHYLHPSLLSSKPEPDSQLPPVSIPQIQYKPSVNCAYSQLVNRIQGGDGQKAAAAAHPDFSQMTVEQQQQYYQYYYAQQYYEYYKQVAAYQQQGQGGNPGQFVQPPDIPNMDPAMQAYIQQIAYQQYLQNHTNTSSSSYAQIISNISKDGGAYPPQLPEDLAKATKEERTVTVVKSEVIAKKPLLSLADYGSESDDETISEEDKPVRDVKEVYKVPAGEALVVIDKMAVYVSKNGEQFEEIIRAKMDPRFEFLNAENEFNKYYRERVRELKMEASGQEEREVGEEKKEEEETAKEVKVVKKEKKVIAPVSFSIKKAKEDHPKELKSALPVEESDDEEEAEANSVVSVNPPTTDDTNLATSSSGTSLMKYSENQKALEQEKIDDGTPTESFERGSTDCQAEKDVPKDDGNAGKIKTKQDETVAKKLLIEDDPIFEMIELTDDMDDDKLDDCDDKPKVPDGVREKSTSAARERALQLERKRKAAAFLKLKTAGGHSEKTENSPEKLETPSRRVSIEIIEIDDESPPKNDQRREKRRRARSESRDRREDKRRKEKKRDRRHKSREKRRRSVSADKEEEESSRKRDEERRERKKKSHKRKHSKTKKKSKRHYKHSDSDSSNVISSS